MPIQIKINPATGEIADLKMIPPQRNVSNYNRNYYYAKTKKVLQCEHCKAMLSTQASLTRHHEKSKKCKTYSTRKRQEWTPHNFSLNQK